MTRWHLWINVIVWRSIGIKRNNNPLPSETNQWIKSCGRPVLLISGFWPTIGSAKWKMGWQGVWSDILFYLSQLFNGIALFEPKHLDSSQIQTPVRSLESDLRSLKLPGVRVSLGLCWSCFSQYDNTCSMRYGEVTWSNTIRPLCWNI